MKRDMQVAGIAMVVISGLLAVLGFLSGQAEATKLFTLTAVLFFIFGGATLVQSWRRRP